MDQQISTGLNEDVAEYYSAVDAHVTGTRIAGTIAAAGGIGMAAAIEAEGAVEGLAVALCTGRCAVGMALAGVLLAYLNIKLKYN